MIENNSLFFAIVDFGKGHKFFKEAKKLGVKDGTFFLGRGTVKSHLLDILGLNEIRKEILMMAIKEEIEETLFEGLNKKFALNKANHGIAFSVSLNVCMRTANSEYSVSSKGQEVKDMKHEAIFTIVNKGLSEDVVEAAELAGSTGATVIHARGANSSEKAMLFNIEIEREKDIVLILADVNKTETIINSIKERLDIEDRGTGIVFTLDVNKTVGLFNGNNK